MKSTEEAASMDKSVLRWGGLAGMLGAILFILSLIIMIIQPAPADAQGIVAMFPTSRTVMIVSQGVYLAAIILLIFFFVSLSQSLRGGSLSPALLGGGLGPLGLVLLVVAGFQVVVLSHISSLYHAFGTTPQDQVTLVLVWQGINGVFNETDTAGGIFLTIGFILIGMAMLRNPTFGKHLGEVTIVLGLFALVGISVISVALDNPNDYAFIILVVVLPLLLGSKLYSLSRAS